MITLTHKYNFLDPFITAASGLVNVQDQFYIIADDENSLVSVASDLKGPARLHPMLKGDLPEDPIHRKKVKADFEAIVYLPSMHSLLCIPSGSKKNRHRGALYNLQNHSIRELSFETIYQTLQTIYAELNIEGAVISDDKIRLFQRGNGKLHQNAIIELNLAHFLEDELHDLSHKEIDLGKIRGIPLSFTDATIENGCCWYLAVAENSESTILDGEFVGAILGKMDLEGNIINFYPLEVDSKPEGLSIVGNIFYVVTDDDDRKKSSHLFSGKLPV